MKKRTFLLGVGIGAIAGLLLAPKKGSELRRDLKDKLQELKDYADDFTVDEAKEKFLAKCDDLLLAIEELDKEALLELAKEKIEILKIKTEELYQYAMNEGSVVAVEKFNELKELVSRVSESVIHKLKKEEEQV